MIAFEIVDHRSGKRLWKGQLPNVHQLPDGMEAQALREIGIPLDVCPVCGCVEPDRVGQEGLPSVLHCRGCHHLWLPELIVQRQ